MLLEDLLFLAFFVFFVFDAPKTWEFVWMFCNALGDRFIRRPNLGFVPRGPAP